MPVASVFSSASAFMCATISTTPSSASTVTQVISPSEENLGANSGPSSTSDDMALLRPTHQRQKALPLVRVAEDTGELRRHRRRAVLLDAAHRHAAVLGLDHHGDPA